MNNLCEQLYSVMFKVIGDSEYSWYQPHIIVRRKDLNINVLSYCIAMQFETTIDKIELLHVQKRTIETDEKDINIIR